MCLLREELRGRDWGQRGDTAGKHRTSFTDVRSKPKSPNDYFLKQRRNRTVDTSVNHAIKSHCIVTILLTLTDTKSDV